MSGLPTWSRNRITHLGHLLVLIFCIIPKNSVAMDVQEVRSDVESNLKKVKSLVCDVEIIGMAGMGSLRQKFTLHYKYPYKIRTVSLSNPGLIFISRRDSSFFKGPAPKKMDESLISTIRTDANGLIFNPLAFLSGPVSSTAQPCGKKICLSYSGSTEPVKADSNRVEAKATRFTGSLEYSPDLHAVESFTLIAEGTSSTSKFQYHRIGGISIPKLIEMQAQGMQTTIRFENVKVNSPLSEGEFR